MLFTINKEVNKKFGFGNTEAVIFVKLAITIMTVLLPEVKRGLQIFKGGYYEKRKKHARHGFSAFDSI